MGHSNIDYKLTSSMKLSPSIVMRPVFFFILLALIVLLLLSLVISIWIAKVKRIEQEVKLISHNLSFEVLSEIEKIAQLLPPVNSSATNLAKFLSSYLDGVNLSFPSIQTIVAPLLFQAISTIPHLTQISFIGLDGLFFSYYTDRNQPFAVYSNSLQSVTNVSIPNSKTNYKWNTQPVNRDTGKLYGEAISSHPLITVNSSWFQEAMVSPNGYAYVGTGWKNGQDLLFLNAASLDGRGVLSLGFSLESLTGFFSGIDYHGGSLYLATKDGEVLTDGIPNTKLVIFDHAVLFELLSFNGSQMGFAGNVTCKTGDDGTLKASVLSIWNTKYTIYCSPLDLAGVQSVYALAMPQKRLESFVEKHAMFAFILLVLMVGALILSVAAFVFLMIRAARREMYLCASLIKQMEATQQAERKSLNKSLAFARASHDVRASLAGLTGLIDVCREEVAPVSDLETNLMLMEACTKDLLGILNSILDTSKIEAGKMQLEEEEFDLAQLLEEVVDLYHPIGMKKGLDVILDPCDGSIPKFSNVKGDRTKLKQILSNLLSNAIKFTSEGHVVVRAWAKRPPSFGDSIFSSSRSGSLHCLSRLFLKREEAKSGLKSMNTIQENRNKVEYVIEVDDTGQGIPKEKQNSVFENYVQVRETAFAQEGTGLGLGIVQSLVRLMGGEIGIMDKEIGEKGTCFRFNIFMATFDSDGNAREDDDDNDDVVVDVESNGGYVSSDSFQHSGAITRALPSPKRDSSHIVLFIRSETRQRISQKFMERLGIKVSAVKDWEQLSQTLKKIKQKLNLSRYSSSGRSDLSSKSDRTSSLGRPPVSRNSSAGAKDVPLSALDGADHNLPPPLHRRTNRNAAPNFVLIVIDTSAGPFREISKALAEFKRDIHNTCCRVIWIDKPGVRNIQSKGLDEDKLPPTDLIISTPFHGTRLKQAIGLLPEFGGTFSSISTGKRKQNSNQTDKLAPPSVLRSSLNLNRSLRIQKGEIQECGSTSSEKPLSGKKILVAEDNAVLRKLATSNVSRLGANVESCENGEEALQLVCKSLIDQRKDGAAAFRPYDYILMDCEMPVMDGFEATRRIREEEKYYEIHIPIIALTAHTSGEEAKRMIQAGMDFHLPKPLKREQLMEAIYSIHQQ